MTTLLPWKNLAGRQLPEKYQKILSQLSWPQTILGVLLPVASPHSVAGILPDLLESIEHLQAYIFAMDQEGQEAKKIFLPAGHMAVLLKQNNVAGIYKSEEKLDLGSWLQKYVPWETEHRLYILDMQKTAIHTSLISKQEASYQLNIHAEIGIEPNQVLRFIQTFLAREMFLDLRDVCEILETSLRASEMFVYPPAEILKSKLREEQIEKKARVKAVQELQAMGTMLLSMEARWSKIEKTAILTASKTPSEPTLEKTVENMERLRQDQSLQEARYSMSKTKPLLQQERHKVDEKLAETKRNMAQEIIQPENNVKEKPKEEKKQISFGQELPIEQTLASLISREIREENKQFSHKESRKVAIPALTRKLNEKEVLERAVKVEIEQAQEKAKPSDKNIPLKNAAGKKKMEEIDIIENSRHRFLKDAAREETNDQ